MKSVGIIGSSHSTGGHILRDGRTTILFEEHFKKYTDNITFINCAHGGKGSELFLRNIIYLKEKYNISHLLMECVHDRTDLNVNVSKNKNIPEFDGGVYPIINTATNVDELLSSIIEYNNMFFLQTFISDEFVGIFKNLEKKEKNWRDIQMLIASDYNMRNFWTIVNLGLSLKLCKLLNISVIGWQQHSNFNDLPIFKEIINQTTDFVMFDQFYDAKSYFKKKYKDDILCDVCHFKENIEEEMIQNFLLPALVRN